MFKTTVFALISKQTFLKGTEMSGAGEENENVTLSTFYWFLNIDALLQFWIEVSAWMADSYGL